jgi:hypothetical protein
LGARWYPEPCLELARGCLRAWAVKELVCEQAQQEPRPLGVPPRVACRAARDAELQVVVQQVPQAEAGAWVLERQQAREQP